MCATRQEGGQPTQSHGGRASPLHTISRSEEGMAALTRAAKYAETEGFRRQLGEAVYEAYCAGIGTRWNSQLEMGTVLGFSEATIKRLMAARKRPEYLEGMRDADIHAVGRALDIPLGDFREDEDTIRLNVVRRVVSLMRAVRLEGTGSPRVEFSDGQITCVWDLVARCDGNRFPQWDEQSDFNSWVDTMLDAIPEAVPRINLPKIVSPNGVRDLVVAAGDWLTVRQYLPSFAHRLFKIAERICRNWDPTGTSDAEEPERSGVLVEEATDLAWALMQVNQLLATFRSTKQGTLEQIAKEMKLPGDKAVYARLEMVGLREAHFRDSDAELGRLIMISKKYKSIARALLAFDSGYGSTSGPSEGRPVR
jgi:hypothetical protein